MTAQAAAQTEGLHHVTAIAGDPQKNIDFYITGLGLRLVKRTVNFDDPGTYHLYYGEPIRLDLETTPEQADDPEVVRDAANRVQAAVDSCIKISKDGSIDTYRHNLPKSAHDCHCGIRTRRR